MIINLFGLSFFRKVVKLILKSKKSFVCMIKILAVVATNFLLNITSKQRIKTNEDSSVIGFNQGRK